jgi:hypothetical protein
MNTQEILSIIDAEIGKLQHVRALLTGYSDPTAPITKRGPGRPKKIQAPAKKAVKRVMSEEARSKIAAAQKKRWAASKKASK